MGKIKETFLKVVKILKKIIVGRFRFKYEYYSPFGECWSVYRLWFGFIPIQYCERPYDISGDTSKVKKYVDSLNKKRNQ